MVTTPLGNQDSAEPRAVNGISSFVDSSWTENGSLFQFLEAHLYAISGTLTVPQQETTPEPGTILGLLAVGSLGVLTRKRKS